MAIQYDFAISGYASCRNNRKQKTSKQNKSGSIVRLTSIKTEQFPDKKLQTIAKKLVEKLLPYFIRKGYTCPKIAIAEKDLSDTIILNDFVNNELSYYIKELKLIT